MRFESENAQIKSFVSHCFINVAHSVSIRHQHWLSYHLAVQEGEHNCNFIHGGNEYSGKLLVLSMHIMAHTCRNSIRYNGIYGPVSSTD